MVLNCCSLEFIANRLLSVCILSTGPGVAGSVLHQHRLSTSFSRRNSSRRVTLAQSLKPGLLYAVDMTMEEKFIWNSPNLHVFNWLHIETIVFVHKWNHCGHCYNRYLPFVRSVIKPFSMFGASSSSAALHLLGPNTLRSFSWYVTSSMIPKFPKQGKLERAEIWERVRRECRGLSLSFATLSILSNRLTKTDGTAFHQSLLFPLLLKWICFMQRQMERQPRRHPFKTLQISLSEVLFSQDSRDRC